MYVPPNIINEILYYLQVFEQNVSHFVFNFTIFFNIVLRMILNKSGAQK